MGQSLWSEPFMICLNSSNFISKELFISISSFPKCSFFWASTIWVYYFCTGVWWVFQPIWKKMSQPKIRNNFIFSKKCKKEGRKKTTLGTNLSWIMSRIFAMVSKTFCLVLPTKTHNQTYSWFLVWTVFLWLKYLPNTCWGKSLSGVCLYSWVFLLKRLDLSQVFFD